MTFENFEIEETLEEFKEAYKTLYYTTYKHEYPNMSYLEYLHKLKDHYGNLCEKYDKDLKEIIKDYPETNIVKETDQLFTYECIEGFLGIEISIEEDLLKRIRPQKPKSITLSNPEKIAVLLEIGIGETLRKFPITEDKYRFIHDLIGGNYDNIRDTMLKGVSNNNIRVAKDFINSKTI